MNVLLSFIPHAHGLNSGASQFTVSGSESQTHGTSAHRWTKTRLQSDRRFLAGQSLQVWDSSKKVSPFVPNLIGKWALTAMLISSVGCLELNITGRSQYAITQGVYVNTTLINPPISISGGNPAYYMSCYLHFPSNTGNFYSPGLVGSASSGAWSWPGNSTLNAINSAFQRLVFEGHKLNISSPLNVQCVQYTGIGVGGIIASGGNNFDLKSTDVLASSTFSTIMPPSPNPSSPSQTTSTVPSVTSQSATTTTSAITLPTSTTGVITLSTVAKMLSLVATTASSLSQTASSFSQSMSAKTQSSTLGSTSQLTIEQDTVQNPSPASDDLNRFGWILIAIAGVLVCLSVSGVLLKKRLKTNTLEKGPKNPAAISNGSELYQQLRLSPVQQNQYDIVGGQYAPPNLQNGQCYTPAPAPLDHRPENRNSPNAYISANAPLESGGTIVQSPGYVSIPDHRPENHNSPNQYISANAPLESGSTIVQSPGYVSIPDHRPESHNSHNPYISVHAPLQSAGTIVQGPDYVLAPAPVGYASENKIPPVPKFV